MRILLLTMYFAPDPAANSVIMTELAEELVQLGHEVTVITAFPHYDSNRIWDQYRGKLIAREDHGPIRVYRTYLYVPANKSKLLGRLFNYVSFNLLSTVTGLLLRGHDILLAPSPPLTIGVTAYLLSRRHRIPFIYNVQDIYPDIAIRLGVLSNRRLIGFFYRLERFVYRKAERVTVLSDGFHQNLTKKGVPAEKLCIIPNFVDVGAMRPLPKENAFSRRHKLHDRFVVMYAGNVGLSQGLETMIDAAEILQDSDDIRWLIVGNGAAKSSLQRLVEEKKLQNITFLPFQPREALAEMYAAADLSVVCLRKGIGGESVPSKAYTIMASGRPILASVGPEAETKRLIDEVRCGMWTEPEDGARFAEAVHSLYRDQPRRAELGYNGRAYVAQLHTPRRVAGLYEGLFEEIISKDL